MGVGDGVGVGVGEMGWEWESGSAGVGLGVVGWEWEWGTSVGNYCSKSSQSFRCPVSSQSQVNCKLITCNMCKGA